MMADERLKFRCYRCNQLISASPGKAGQVVACPKCKAELQVPRPEAEPAKAGVGGERRGPARADAAELPAPPQSPAAESTAPLPSFMAEIAAAIPDDLAALRPEDIRVEAEFADLVITTQPEPAPEQPPPAPIPATTPRPADPPIPAAPPAPPAPVPPIPEVTAAAAPPADPGLGVVLPPIAIEPPSILPPGHVVRPVREVVLQPATVLAWSLMVLMAIPLAFIAGLLVGHFLWR
jgi:hypothetical protein